MGKVTTTIALALLGLFFLNACASGHCRSRKEQKKLVELDAVTTEEKKSKRMMIYKPDGSLQCSMGKKVSAKSMAKQLDGVIIFRSENRSDGMMHIQACGTPTGMINVYEISSDQFEMAKKKGFKEFKK